MHRATFALSLVVAVALVGSPPDLAAQNGIEILPRSATLRVGGRLQTQLQVSSVDDVPADVLFRRARLRVDVKVDDFLDGRINPEFAGSGTSLQDAWVRMSFDPAFRVSFGQFKRAFSAFELASSTDLPIIERDGRVHGVDSCAGVGGVCSFSRMTGSLSFDGRDAGLRVEGRFDGGFSYMATVTNGEGVGARDVNDAKSVSGRLTYDAGRFTLGAFGGLHDHERPTAEGTETGYAPAGGVDLEIGTWRDGFHLLAALAIGGNWKVAGDPSFTTAQILASWFVPTGDGTVGGVEPLLRLGWSDPDTGVADDAGLLVTPGVMVYFTGKNGVSANIDTYVPGGGEDAEFSFKLQSYLYF